MLYFLYGDVQKAAHKAQGLVDSLLARQPDAGRFKLDGERFDVSEFEGLLGGQGLFSARYIIELRRIFDDATASDTVIGALAELAESPNVFIWVEPSVTAGHAKRIEKYAAKVQEFTVREKPKIEYNAFALADALGERDKKKLWMGYIDALEQLPVEEIHGTLFWQVKSMLLATKCETAAEAGMKDFPFNKAKRFAKKFTLDELLRLSRELLAVSHDARRGQHDFAIALERWVLSI